MVDKHNNPVVYVVEEEKKLIGEQIDLFNKHYQQLNKEQFKLGNTSAQLRITKEDEELSYNFWVNIGENGQVSRSDKKTIVSRFAFHDFNGDGFVSEDERTPAPEPEFTQKTVDRQMTEAKKLLEGNPDAKMALKPLQEMMDLASRNQRLSVAEFEAINGYAEVLRTEKNLHSYDFNADGKLLIEEVLPASAESPFSPETATRFVQSVAAHAKEKGLEEKQLEPLYKMVEKAASNNVLSIAENRAMVDEMKKLGVDFKEGEPQKPTAGTAQPETKSIELR